MARLKGSKNKDSETRPLTSTLSSQDRIKFLANLIIDRILEDQRNDNQLLKKLNITELT